MLVYARDRALDIRRIARVHRDPFEPILPVFEAASPIGEYRKICEEIECRLPDAKAHPIEAAEAIRSLLMLRLGLHLGLRQKNLRELLLCPRGRRATPERKLEVLRRGELRWTGTDWEVLIAAAAFKNAGSSFFEGRPFRVELPDIGGLYALISGWISKHRPILIGRAADPGTVFVATARGPKADVTLDKPLSTICGGERSCVMACSTPSPGKVPSRDYYRTDRWGSRRPGHPYPEGHRLI